MVVLTHPILGDREFELDHAERILAMENNGGWTKKRKRKEQKGAATNRDQGDSIKAQAQTTDSDCGCS